MDVRQLTDDNRGTAVMVIFWTQIAIATLVVGLRLWGRVMIRNVGWDDHLMVLTLLCMIGFSCFATSLASKGGFHNLYSQRMEVTRMYWISQPFALFPFATGKASIAVFLLRIAGRELRLQRYLLYAVIFFSFVITFMDILITFVQCSPVAALWRNERQLPGVCWDPEIHHRLSVFAAVWNVFGDFFLALIPITMLWNLELSLQKKIGICVLLGLGMIAGMAGITKTIYITALNADPDSTWISYDIFAWSISELFVTVLCGSLPAIKPLYDHYVRKKSVTEPTVPEGQGYQLDNMGDGGNNLEEASIESTERLTSGSITSDEFAIRKHTRVSVRSEYEPVRK